MSLRILGTGSIIALLALGAVVGACDWGDRSVKDNDVVFDALIAGPPQYAGRYARTAGVYVDGFEPSGLAASVYGKKGLPHLTESVSSLENADFQSRKGSTAGLSCSTPWQPLMGGY